ncbi:MAG: sigma-70 family RNA polymerase sigma factor [Candidatus Poribacteria bacterium]|nr:sigma-70 family RNA polymerase sigma factor [Candidatus Poribacteria bacterium]
MFDTDEKQLITRTQHGDTEAFTPLVTTYQSRLYTHILGRIKDTETAKDLTQETWIKAFHAINTFRADASFYSWLYRIAENVCIDYYRKQKVAHTIEPIHDIDECRITDTHPCPSQDIARQELRQQLQKAVKHLTPTRKRVFLLYYIHEMPIKTIATRMKRSEGTIKTHLRNARLQLRERLTPYLKNQHIPWLA